MHLNIPSGFTHRTVIKKENLNINNNKNIHSNK